MPARHNLNMNQKKENADMNELLAIIECEIGGKLQSFELLFNTHALCLYEQETGRNFLNVQDGPKAFKAEVILALLWAGMEGARYKRSLEGEKLPVVDRDLALQIADSFGGVMKLIPLVILGPYAAAINLMTDGDEVEGADDGVGAGKNA